MPKTHLDALRVTQKEHDSMDKARLKLGAVPVRIAARVYGRDPAWVRAGIIAGWLPIGEATRNATISAPLPQPHFCFLLLFHENDIL